MSLETTACYLALAVPAMMLVELTVASRAGGAAMLPKPGFSRYRFHSGHCALLEPS
jgi:hypothetical protein